LILYLDDQVNLIRMTIPIEKHPGVLPDIIKLLYHLCHHHVFKQKATQWITTHLGRAVDPQKVGHQTCIIKIELGGFNQFETPLPGKTGGGFLAIPDCVILYIN